MSNPNRVIGSFCLLGMLCLIIAAFAFNWIFGIAVLGVMLFLIGMLIAWRETDPRKKP